jgi:tartrate dehydratase beta subunit/fumarate hydratase class I family protein
VANNIIYPAIGGNYVVTPSHLKGSEPIYFVGPAPDAPQPEKVAAGPTPAQP